MDLHHDVVERHVQSVEELASSFHLGGDPTRGRSGRARRWEDRQIGAIVCGRLANSASHCNEFCSKVTGSEELVSTESMNEG